jgi:type II secretory pathway pseudopilin PulG
MSALRSRLGDGEAGMTLIELLVAASMGVVLLGAVGAMLISAVRQQPNVSERSQSVTTARVVLERMTREIRNGLQVYEASPSKVAFETQVRRTACGAGGEEDPEDPAIHCRVTYSCSTSACVRFETLPDVAATGGGAVLVTGLQSGNVFNWEEEPSSEEESEITYIGATLRIPNPEGSGYLNISDGASLRTVILTG